MKKLLALCLLTFSLAACDKSFEKAPETCKDGYMRWRGDPALDGIEWYFSEDAVDGQPQAYKFDNLPEAYQQDSLAVRVCFYITDKTFPCYCGVPLKVYHITSIKKR
jgi:hypothetical protein